MGQFLYGITEQVARIHSKILALNDAYEYNFTDKELHFIVIGLLGMLLVLIIHPIFLWLAKHDHVIAITWIYVATLILVITFAIEIGQRITGTGLMEFEDIVFGIVGFLVMFVAFDLLRRIVRRIIGIFRK